MKNRRAIFIDRDGVINKLRPDPESGNPESPLSVEEVKLFGNVSVCIAKLQSAGFLIVGVTNQPSAAKGRISIETQNDIQGRVIELLQSERVILDAWKMCPHHPNGIVETLTRICDCRKPNPGMLLEAADELEIDLPSSWMIGDSDSDIEAGHSAGTHTALIGAGNSHKRKNQLHADLVCDTLDTAVDEILELSS